jgi:hypothetical protein
MVPHGKEEGEGFCIDLAYLLYLLNNDTDNYTILATTSGI